MRAELDHLLLIRGSIRPPRREGGDDHLLHGEPVAGSPILDHLTVAHARIRRPGGDLGAHDVPKLFVRTRSHHAQHLAAAADGSEQAIAASATIEHRQAMLIRHQVVLFHRLVHRRRASDEVRLSGRRQTRVCVNGERAVEGLRVADREQLWPRAERRASASLAASARYCRTWPLGLIAPVRELLCRFLFVSLRSPPSQGSSAAAPATPATASSARATALAFATPLSLGWWRLLGC